MRRGHTQNIAWGDVLKKTQRLQQTKRDTTHTCLYCPGVLIFVSGNLGIFSNMSHHHMAGDFASHR